MLVSPIYTIHYLKKSGLSLVLCLLVLSMNIKLTQLIMNSVSVFLSKINAMNLLKNDMLHETCYKSLVVPALEISTKAF